MHLGYLPHVPRPATLSSHVLTPSQPTSQPPKSPAPHRRVPMSLCHRGRAPPVPQAGTAPTLADVLCFSTQLHRPHRHVSQAVADGRRRSVAQASIPGIAGSPGIASSPAPAALARVCRHCATAAPGRVRFVLLIRGCPCGSLCLILAAPLERELLPRALAARRVPVLPSPGAVLPGSSTFCLAFGDNYTPSETPRMCRAGGLQINSSLYRTSPKSQNANKIRNKKAITREKACTKNELFASPAL